MKFREKRTQSCENKTYNEPELVLIFFLSTEIYSKSHVINRTVNNFIFNLQGRRYASLQGGQFCSWKDTRVSTTIRVMLKTLILEKLRDSWQLVSCKLQRELFSSSFSIPVSLHLPKLSLFLFGLLVSLWCLSAAGFIPILGGTDGETSFRSQHYFTKGTKDSRPVFSRSSLITWF